MPSLKDITNPYWKHNDDYDPCPIKAMGDQVPILSFGHVLLLDAVAQSSLQNHSEKARINHLVRQQGSFGKLEYNCFFCNKWYLPIPINWFCLFCKAGIATNKIPSNLKTVFQDKARTLFKLDGTYQKSFIDKIFNNATYYSKKEL